MSHRNFQPETAKIIDLKNTNKWQVFHRLQSLGVPCQCGSHKPLLVQIEDALAAVQFWSVIKQSSASRDELIDWLNRCWQMK